MSKKIMKSIALTQYDDVVVCHDDNDGVGVDDDDGGGIHPCYHGDVVA